MNGRTLERMKHFVGRVCSIVSTSMNRSFDEQIAREHFVVRVQEVTPDGIWGCHPYNDEMISFFAMLHIISIHQEIELDPSNPEHAEMIREYEEKSGKKASSDLHGSPKEKPSVPQEQEGGMTFVDIEHLERLADSSRKAFDNLLE